jgi:spore germination protein KB
MLVDAFATLPRGITLKLSTAGPWAILVAGLIAFLLFWPVAASLTHRPGRGLIDLVQSAGGRPLAVIVTLLLGAYVIAAGGMSLRQFSEMAITSVFPHTPQTFLMSSLLGVAALCAAVSPAALVWVSATVTYPFVGAILIVVLGNFGWGKFALVLPPTGHGLLPAAGAIMPLTSYFGELFFIAALAGYGASPEKLVRCAAKTTAMVAVVWALVVLVCIMVYSVPLGLALPYPLFEMTRNVIGGRFLERIDALWIVVWGFGSAGRLGSMLMAASLLFQEPSGSPATALPLRPWGRRCWPQPSSLPTRRAPCRPRPS